MIPDQIRVTGTPESSGSGGPSNLDAQHPWPGLASYDEASQDFFCGRDEDARKLLRLIRLAPLTVLYGKSGLGKSSLLQAGLFPRLRVEHYLPVYLRVDFSERAESPPLEQVARRLEKEIIHSRADCTPREPGEDLWQYLHRKDLEIWSTDNFLLTPILVFDQFEELFSHSGNNLARIKSIFNSLADLIENRIPSELVGDTTSRERRAQLDLLAQRYRIVLAVREDFLPDIDILKDKVPSLLRNRLRLLPMSRDQAIMATEEAGAAVLEEGVAFRIVDLIAKSEVGSRSAQSVIEPVLLSLCCTQLNRRRASGGKIDTALVSSVGQDILETFYREALDGMPERVPQFIETHLIQGDRYRGSYPRDDAISRGVLTIPELENLTDHYRLLRIDQQPDTARIELIHDSLVAVVREARDERLAREREQRVREEAERKAKRLFWRLAYGFLVALFTLSIIAFWAYSQWLETRPWGYMKNLSSGTVYALNGNVVSVGRSTEGYFQNQISLVPNAVSRLHALLSRDFSLLDMRSLVGTMVNANFLPYGNSAELADGDIVALGGVAPFEFEIINYAPFHFWVPPPKRPLKPQGWAVLIDGRARAVHYLTEAEQFVDMDTDGRLQVNLRGTANSLMRIKRDERWGITIENLQEDAELWAIMKDGDYTYPKCRIPSGRVFDELKRADLLDCQFWLRRHDYIETKDSPDYPYGISLHYREVPFQIVPILHNLEPSPP